MITTGKITWQVLREHGIEPAPPGLARFIPEEGVGVGEFLSLPVEQILEQVQDIPGVEKRINILFTPDLLPDDVLISMAVFAANFALDIFESEHPQDSRLRVGVEVKERFLRGRAGQNELMDAWRRAQRVISVEKRSSSEAGVVAYRFVGHNLNDSILELASAGVNDSAALAYRLVYKTENADLQDARAARSEFYRNLINFVAGLLEPKEGD